MYLCDNILKIKLGSFLFVKERYQWHSTYHYKMKAVVYEDPYHEAGRLYLHLILGTSFSPWLSTALSRYIAAGLCLTGSIFLPVMWYRPQRQ